MAESLSPLPRAPHSDPPPSPLLSGAARESARVIAGLRESDPVHWVGGLEAWFVSRHDDVQQLFGDPRVTADPRVFDRYVAPTEPGAERWMADPPFIASTPGAPSVSRRLVSPALTSRAIARLAGTIDEVVEQFAAPLRKRRDAVDLAGEFSNPIPGTVIGRLLGVPPKSEDEARFHKLSRNMVRLVNPVLTDKKRRKTERATVELCDYLLDLVRERRVRPREDLLSAMAKAGEAQGVGEDEIVRTASGLISAGTETITLSATRGLHTLFQHPAELDRLRRDPSLVPSAVNELLRYDMGLFGMPRYVLESFTLRGRRFEQGQLVVLSFMGAHRDPNVFDAPDRLDLGRDTRKLIVFGRGEHHCIGANIARAELNAIFTSALEFIPRRARLQEEAIRWGGVGILDRIKTLPVDFSDA